MNVPSRQLIQRFAITFGLASAAIGIGVLLSSGNGDTGTGRNAAADTTADVTETAEISSSSSPPTTDVVATEMTDVREADASLVSEPASTELRELRPLPVPDLGAFCVSLYGEGSTAVNAGDLTTARCGLTTGATAGIDLDAACRTQFGAGDAVQIAVEPRGIRCTDPAAISLAPVDYEAYCDSVLGVAAERALVADDWQGWRCAGIGNGVFQLFELKPGAVCQTVLGRETYAVAAGTTIDAWSCYGLP